MAKQTINIGAAANDGTGDPLRSAFDKCNDNFDELYPRTQGPGAPISLTAATWTPITLPTAYDDTDYQFIPSAYDSDGNEVGLRRRNKTASGIEVRAAVSCTLEYITFKS